MESTSRRAKRTRAAVTALLFLSLTAHLSPARADEFSGSGRPRTLPVGMGLDVDLASASAAAELFPGAGDATAWPSLALRIRVPWSSIEDQAGVLQWRELDRALLAADDHGLPVVLVLTGPAPDGSGAPPVVPATVQPGSATAQAGDSPELTAWLRFVSGVTERAAGRVGAFAIWEHANDPASWGRAPSARELAYLIKRSAIAIRAVDSKAFVAQGALRASATWQSDLLAEGIAPFVDAYGIDFAGLTPEDADTAKASLLQSLLTSDPGAAPWIHHAPAGTPRAAALWRDALAARDGDIGLSTFDLGEPGGADATDVSLVLQAYARAFPPDSTAAPSFGKQLVEFPKTPATVVRREVVASDLGSRTSFWPVEKPATGAYVDVRINAPGAEKIRLVDPTLQWEGPVKQVVKNGERGFIARLPLLDRPLVLAFERPEEQEPAEKQDVAVKAEAIVSVEEILARHLEVQAARERQLQSLVTDLTTDVWYQLGATGRALEIRLEGRYFEDSSGRREVENQRYYLNGALVHGGKKGLPEIPLLQPEKVTVVPLEVHLDKSYAYTLVRKDQVRGRPAWVVDFKPTEADATRYAGTVWIDAETYDRLKVQTVQTNLEAPVMSSEQEDYYQAIAAADGSTHQLIVESDIERTVSIIGANVVVRMKQRFTNHRVNDPGFETARTEAYASSNQMLRDTEEGFQYLRKQPDGTRAPGPSSPKKIAWAAGARYDSSYGGVLPLGGFNYLNWDVGGKGLQMNAFVAGAFNTLSLSDPSLWGKRLEGSVDVSLPLVRRRDQLLLPGQDIHDETTVRSWEPSITLGLGVPVGRFGKFGLDLDLDYEGWQDDDDTAPDFEAPVGTGVGTLRLKGEVHRQGWDVRVAVARVHRLDWEPWGPNGGTESEEYYEPGDQDYWLWNASLAHRWFVGKLQAASLGVSWYGGSGLDRFSQYEFGGFGAPDVPGFGGSGIHFNEGGVARASYGVDVAGLFGLDVVVAYSRFRNHELAPALVDEFGDWADALGVGLVGTIPGPARSVIIFDIGYALSASDHEEAEGGLVAQVLFTKIVK